MKSPSTLPHVASRRMLINLDLTALHIARSIFAS